MFPNVATGRKALSDLLHQGYYQSLSVDQAISQYAPKKENDTAAYQSFIRSTVGVSGDVILNNLNAVQFNGLMNAIQQFEGWRVGTVYIYPAEPPL